MQTIASMANRLEMTAEEAVERLQYMLFEVESVDSEINDDLCDILIDVDDEPSTADRVRQEKLDKQEKDRKRNERLKAAAKKAAAKRKADKEKKEKVKAEKKAAEEAEKKAAEEAAAEEAPEDKPKKKSTKAKKKADAPVVEILPADPSEAKADEPAEPAIIIGAAVEKEEPTVEVVRADGTHLDGKKVDLAEIPDAEPAAEEPEEEVGLLAEAERRQEEEEERKRPAATPSAVRPDPAVVEEVKRRAAERSRRQATGPRAPRSQAQGAGSTRSTGKTARKRQKKAERVRQEETMRRDAAAAVREIQAGAAAGAAPKKRRRKRSRDEDDGEMGVDVAQETQIIEVEDGTTVEQFAALLEVPVNEIILDLMDHEVMATKNQVMSIELIRELAEARDVEVHSVIPEEVEVLAEKPDDPADLKPRPPVITVMGHVDHGKTTLLDRIRTANVVDGEAGGITQHIAAYDVPTGDNRVVFLDTPGHEAFTQMRARGAQCTDIVILVVAADDGVMPQTIEAIDHAKAAEVPIVVAVNKCDKEGAQPERIRQELTRFDLLDEEWGGKTVMKDISAITGDGVDELMELLVLQAEMMELKANANKRARGAVVESELSKGQGPVAWVLVQSGTLKVGDVFLAGSSFGRVRAMLNARGESVQEAGPSTPVVVTGFDSVPEAGDVFAAVEDERVARAIATKRGDLAKQKQGQPVRHITLEDFHERLLAGEQSELNVVLKADVQGSVDVVASSLSKLGNEEVKVKLVHTGVGGINESDILLASASDAVIIGFHVAANPRVQKIAEAEGVDVHTYQVIYEAIEAVRQSLEGMLAPDSKEVITGHVEIRAVFKSSALGNIAGCMVTDGTIERGSMARLTRDDIVVYDGKLSSLRREKDDARSVQSGFECGLKLENFEDIKVGDVVETYTVESVAKTLA
jgi:translation initiation factor IF-2